MFYDKITESIIKRELILSSYNCKSKKVLIEDDLLWYLKATYKPGKKTGNLDMGGI